MPDEKITSPDIREEYIARVRRMLLGPGSEPRIPDVEHEVVAVNPVYRYTLGIIYAKGATIDEQELDEPLADEEEAQADGLRDDQDADMSEEAVKASKKAAREALRQGFGSEDGDYDDSLDGAVNMATQYHQSSLGLICLVRGETTGIKVDLSCGTYRHVDVDNKPSECHISFRPIEAGFSIPKEFAPYLSYDTEQGLLSLKQRLPHGLNHAYRGAHGEECKRDDMKDFLWCTSRLYMQQKEGRVRTPHSKILTLDFSTGDICRLPWEDGVVRCSLVARRKRIHSDLWSLTIMLVNEKEASGKMMQAEDCIFQAKISIKAEEADAFRFVDTHLGEIDLHDEEEDELALIYRHKHSYATGLGTAAQWEIRDGLGTVSTTFFPQAEVPQMDFALPDDAPLKNADLSMKRLSDFGDDKDSQMRVLTTLVDYYAQWIERLEREELPELDGRSYEAGLRNLSRCHQAQERMRSGLRVLRDNDMAYKAFTLANRAMFMQRLQLRLQSKFSEKVRYPDDAVLAVKLDQLTDMEAYRREKDARMERDGSMWTAYWRPFQIAFLLMSLPDIVDDQAMLRDTVDLIWFPTGGGKTEAYLGLTAFTICYRRLAHKEEEAAGTTVIMRYTLRLLTTQQFNRASTLICALELMRRNAPCQELGVEPITIGLWIGSGHTPNQTLGKGFDYKHPTAEEMVLEMDNVKHVRDVKLVRNKFQALKCPWCGTSLVMGAEVPPGKKNRKLMGAWGYHIGGQHFYMACPNEHCHFHDILPLQVVDSELYQQPPTLLFATVDKFAMMSWKGSDIVKFFGTEDENRRAPELIIQDELHLISSSLGTMVGLYETALDYVCQKHGVKPKIIASTATARRAREQCAQLYNRDMFQFPPAGLDVADSFFAREKPYDHITPQRFGRKYIGLMPSGKTKVKAEVHHMAALLELTKSMKDLTPEQLDQLWTLTVYFGSLRDLGHAQSLVSDEVQDMINRISEYMHLPARTVPYASELTSRISTSRLVETLDQLEKVKYKGHVPEDGRWPVNLLLATNMISVGLDVPRLNVMLVVGQPKLISEYIQSTSRIGRKDPGIAFVTYNPVNSRDRSHFEQFQAFHQAFYREVEPSVVTPYSVPALQRALPAVLFAMMWLSMPHTFTGNDDAIEFNLEDPLMARQANACKEFVVERMRQSYQRSRLISAEEIEREAKDLGKRIDKVFNAWSAEAMHDKQSDRKLSFGLMMPKGKKPRGFTLSGNHLLQVTYEQKLDWQEELQQEGNKSWLAMTSMRNVDKEIDGRLIRFAGGREDEY